MRNWWSLAITLVVATGCGPVYETQYRMVPPSDGNGRMCVSQCQQTQTYCRSNCQMVEQACLANERERAHREYEHYVWERRSQGREIKRDPDSFYNAYNCSRSSCEDSCASDYRQCFSNCGGAVIPNRVCTAFCEPPAPPPALAPAPRAPAAPGAPALTSLCVKGTKLQAYSGDDWYDAIVKTDPLPDGRCPVHYDGFKASDDETVLPTMLRPRPR
jgi:hypothetical protein